MIESIMSLKISGRCFTPAAKLKCFTQDKSRISIIYGKNGSGKSTISKALCKVEPDLKSELLDENNNKVSVHQDNTFIFNEDYIKNNVEVQDDGLSAVILLGEQVDIDKQITEANVQLERIKSELETERTAKTILEDVKNSDSYKYKIDKLKDKLKASDNWTGREFSISGKRPNIAVTTLQKIFNHVPDSKTKEEAIARFKESMSIIGTAHRGKITGVMKPVLFENTFFQSISELLSEKIEQPILNDRDKLIIEIYKQKGSQFIAEVKDIFNIKTQNICPYCFRAITNEEKNSILLGVEKVLSEIAKKHQLKLQQYKKQIAQAIDALDKIIIIADNFQNIYPDEYDAFEAQYRIINSLLAEYMQCIEDKINSIYNPVLLVDNNIVQEFHKLNLVIECLEKKRRDYNNQIDKINESKQKASVWNAEIAYWEFYAEYAEYQKAWHNYQKCCEKFNKHEVDFNIQEAKIEELLNQKKNVAIAKDNINKALSYIFFSTNRLQLDADAENGKYYLISNGIKVTPNKVSTGERNIIALCYFFTQILNNHDAADNYSDEYFIVIDDPISSFDTENKVGVITYLKYQLSEILNGNHNSKVILLSHDLATVYDFEKAGEEIGREMHCGKNYVENFELKDRKIDNSHHIDKQRHEYSQLMKEVFKFASGNNSLLSDFTVGNSMRRLLEAYGTFVYKKGIDSLTTNEEILALCRNHKNYFKHYMYRLVLNGESHFQERVLSLKDTYFFENFTTEQLMDTAQKILCFLYLINPLHVKEHLKEDGFTDHESVIQEWIKTIPTS